jgi:hypothetical protein
MTSRISTTANGIQRGPPDVAYVVFVNRPSNILELVGIFHNIKDRYRA